MKRLKKNFTMDYSSCKCDRERFFKICPNCQSAMVHKIEKYNLNVPYTDSWWECTNPNCEYCLNDINERRKDESRNY